MPQLILKYIFLDPKRKPRACCYISDEEAMSARRVHSLEFRVSLMETEYVKLIAEVPKLKTVTEELKEENVYLRECYKRAQTKTHSSEET